METLAVSVISLLIAFVSGQYALRRKRLQLRLVSAADPALDVVRQLEKVGFIWFPNRQPNVHRLKPDDVAFVARSGINCGACCGTVYRLCRTEDFMDGKTLVDFGNVCAHCHRLHSDEWDAPMRIRFAWQGAVDLSDFLARMKRGSDQSEEPLAERKKRLEKQVADIDHRRDTLRSQLLSVKNRLGETIDDEPYR
ncbi:MAG: hypothetical protein WC866_04735 [Patescibacteria group bacterium]|jgi:hypothetical protein